MTVHTAVQMAEIINQMFLNLPDGMLELFLPLDTNDVFDAIMNDDGSCSDSQEFPMEQVNEELAKLNTCLVIEDVAFTDGYLVRPRGTAIRHVVTLMDVQLALSELGELKI